MNTIKSILDEISLESSTNAKMEILAKYKDNETLKRVLYLMYSKRIKFYIKQIPEYLSSDKPTMTIVGAIDHLDKIINRELTGHAAQDWLKSILQTLSQDDANVIERIIDKDARIGMAESNINKIFPKLIETTPYMGAISFNPEKAKAIFDRKMPIAYSQVKMDGRYANAIVRNGEVELESRAGEPTTLYPDPAFMLHLRNMQDVVLNGELTIPGISRHESNGIIASLISIGKKVKEGKDWTKESIRFEDKHGIKYADALDSIVYTVWDEITIDEYYDAKSDRIYSDRLFYLTIIISELNSDKVKLIESKTVDTFEEAIAHFQELLNRGEEGAILKSSTGTWKDGKPNWQIKMKLEMDIDLKIVGFNYGTGKNSELISSLNCETSDGLLKTKPTGISEDMMKYITENQESLYGKIIECKCSGLSHDSDGNYSVLHPVFKSIRDDKDTCDSLQSVKEIEAMAKGLI